MADGSRTASESEQPGQFAEVGPAAQSRSRIDETPQKRKIAANDFHGGRCAAVRAVEMNRGTALRRFAGGGDGGRTHIGGLCFAKDTGSEAAVVVGDQPGDRGKSRSSIDVMPEVIGTIL
ncbi:hypothetical protein [Candidatus Accumulibacter sp. ACC012]|uniref:hypothetical protein n=1 Tax=Candidatus Accumulibacter sp. ACC012 TaxID=2823332 RepID=UPI0025C134AD|nr:hypothetical protein [Candidatus Accumulibacter sp. ACC012]